MPQETKPEFKSLKYAEGTDLEGTLEYVRVNQFVIYTSIDEPCQDPSLVLVQDIHERIELEEWADMWDLPGIVYFDLQTCQGDTQIPHGMFRFYHVSAEGDNFAFHSEVCPPQIKELFASYIGGDKPMQITSHNIPFDQYERLLATPPETEIAWLSEALRPLGLTAGIEKGGQKVVLSLTKPGTTYSEGLIYCGLEILDLVDDIDGWSRAKAQIISFMESYERRVSDHSGLIRTLRDSITVSRNTD